MFLAESFILLALHEIFSSALAGHYLLFINEEILTKIYGDEYLNSNTVNKGETENNKAIS